jgi:hypothetical protein
MKKISRRQFMRVSAVASAGAVLAACGTPEPEETPVATEEVVEATATKPPAPTATPGPEPTAVPEEEQVWPRVDVPRELTITSEVTLVQLV